MGMEGWVVRDEVEVKSGKIPALRQQFRMVVVSTSAHASSAIHIACN
jgi:hypothetical protein